MGLNSGYLSSSRGAIKIGQIVVGIIISILLCNAWFGGSRCYSDGRLGYCTTLNSIVVIINIVLFVVNILSIGMWKLERIYTIVCVILFAIAAGIMIWFLVVARYHSGGYYIAATILMAVQFALFVWDMKILQGDSPNYTTRTI